METKQTLKLVGYYRLLSWLSFAVGVAIAGLGVYLGLGETISILLESFPAEFDRAVAAANPIIAVALSVVGLLVWQVGKSVALTKTMERAIATEESGTDDEQLKSEVLDVVNDQISGVEKDLRSDIRDIERRVESDDDGFSAGTAASTGTGSTGRATRRSDSGTASNSSASSTGQGSEASTTGRSSEPSTTGERSASSTAAGSAEGSTTAGSADSSGSQSGSRRSSSRSGSDRASRSQRSQSGGRTGSESAQSGAANGGDGDRATDAVSEESEERSRRKTGTDGDEDDDPLP